MKLSVPVTIRMDPTTQTNLSQHYLQIQALTPVAGAKPVDSTAEVNSLSLQQYTSTIIIVFIGLLLAGSIGLIITKTRYINKLIVVLFIALLTSAIPITMHTLSQQQSVETKASHDYIPTNIKITQVNSQGFSILWDTNQPALGTIRVWKAADAADYNRVFSEPDSGDIYRHLLVVSGLAANTEYNLEILSNGDWYNNHGEPVKITTYP